MARQAMPETITGFFEAHNAHDAERLAACFTEDGVVRDENTSHAGRAAIAGWQREVGDKYAAHVVPAAIQAQEELWRVTATVSGRFPGSPLTLHFSFQLRGGHIASLEIAA